MPTPPCKPTEPSDGTGVIEPSGGTGEIEPSAVAGEVKVNEIEEKAFERTSAEACEAGV